jgi:hypothetical protein
MIRSAYTLIGITSLMAAACSETGTDALLENPLTEAIPADDGNAGEPPRPMLSSSTVDASSCGSSANGGWHFCSAACPCDAGEGDCDGTDECATGLTCVKNIGATYGWDPDVDVCEATCHPSANGGFHYCSASCPCTAGEGDCDSNSECMPGLTCVKDVGPRYGWDEDVDVCEDTCHPSANGGFHYCSASCPCTAGEGDCDSNSECMPGLTCVKDVGPSYGWDEDVDVCEGNCDDTGGSCNPGCPCDPAGTSLFVQVLDLEGQPISTAAVTMGDTPQPTDGGGRILLEDLPAGRVVARVEAYGFAPASVAVDLADGTHAGAEIRLRPLGTPIPFEAESGTTIEQPAARVTIPPGALVDHDGNPVTGTVDATVVPLDPSQAKSDTLPGPLQGHAAGTGAAVELESVVMAEVSLWQNGLPVQLAPGARATLELALPDAVAGQYQIGESIPAWWLDLDAGIWREEGAGTIQPSSSEPGKLAWVVEVGHFTWWNCDRPWTDKHSFAVTIEDASGNPVRNFQVSAQGVSYTSASRSSYTRDDGQACVEIKRDGTADIVVGPASTPLATQRLTGSGPAADCSGNGVPATPITIRLQEGAQICTPGTSIPCPYNGPPGTECVGVCQASRNQCNAAGTAWSGCIGEVLPSTETCTNPFDEDCDGEADDGLDCAGCSIGQRISCYSGPPATIDVGMCRAGTRRCSVRRVFETCENEVLPQPETCETPGDDNCDGTSECIALPLWSRRFGGANEEYVTGEAVDNAGNMLLTGYFSGTADFGGEPLSSAAHTDIFIVKLDAQGQHLWSRRFGGSQFDYGGGIAVDSVGNVLLTGVAYLTDFGGGPVGWANVFVVKLDSQGQHVWTRGFPAQGFGFSIAVDSAGNVLLTGVLRGTMNFGGGPISSPDGHGIFVVKLDSYGQHLWSRSLGGTGEAVPTRIAVNGSGNVLLTGYFYDTVNFGGAPITSAGRRDIFAVGLNAQGEHLWSHGFGGMNDDTSYDIVADSAGNVLITGSFQNMADFGGGQLSSAGYTDVFVVKLDVAGQHLWSRRFGGTFLDEGVGIATDSSDNVIIAGGLTRTVDYGGGPLSSAGPRDIFALKLDTAGQHVWSRRFGGPNTDDIVGLAAGSAGNVLVTGRFQGMVDVGLGPLFSVGPHDIFAFELTP